VQNQDIECPKCGYEFAITEALARPIVEAERNRLELEIRQRSTALAAQEEKLHGKRQKLDDEQKKLKTEAAKNRSSRSREVGSGSPGS
jgi:Skp family chaperone for outer membrane proteins